MAARSSQKDYRVAPNSSGNEETTGRSFVVALAHDVIHRVTHGFVPFSFSFLFPLYPYIHLRNNNSRHALSSPSAPLAFRHLGLLNLVQRIVVRAHPSVVHLLEPHHDRVTNPRLIHRYDLSGIPEPVRLGPQNPHRRSTLRANLRLLRLGRRRRRILSAHNQTGGTLHTRSAYRVEYTYTSGR